MAATFYFSDTDSDLTGGADFNKVLKTSVSGAGSLSVTVASGASSEVSYAWTEAGTPNNSTWDAGTITVEMQATTANKFVSLRVRATRVDSSGNVEESSSYTAAQSFNNTTVKTFSIASYTWGTAGDPVAVGDRLRIDFDFSETSGFGDRTVVLETNTTDQEVVTSLTVLGGSHPTPVSLRAEFTFSPTSNAYEFPIFDAIFKGSTSSAKTTACSIEIAEATSWGVYGSFRLVGASRWLTVSPGSVVSHNGRFPYQTYGSGSHVWNSAFSLSSDPPKDRYYWRIKFRDTSAAHTESVWSDNNSAAAQISGFKRTWHAPGYVYRQKLYFDTAHRQVNKGYTADFKIKTGNRKPVASNGWHNESIEAAGGSQIARYGNKTHIIYQANSTYDDYFIEIYIVSINHITGEVGTPVRIAITTTTLDIHYFPVINIDTQGYIHVFYGGHGFAGIKYLRSRQPNISGSLAGETSDWINPANGSSVPASVGSLVTYPVSFSIPSTGRTYMSYRYGASGNSPTYKFVYTDDTGASWSAEQRIMNDTNVNKYRIYAYGNRFDESNERWHMAYTYMHVDGGDADIPQGIWYTYSDYDVSTAGFNKWYKAGGVQIATTELNPIDFDNDSSNAIYRVDSCNSCFIEDLVIHEKKAIPTWIKWPYPMYDDFRIEEGWLRCAVWSSASMSSAGFWSIKNISEQINRKQNFARTGSPATPDRDNILHMWMCANSISHSHQRPNTDATYTSATRSPGANSYYTYVDDLESSCDGFTSHLYGGAGWGCSFTSSQDISLPRTSSILGIDIEAVARRASASNGQIKLFLRYGGVNHSSNAFSVAQNPAHLGGSINRWLRYSTVWSNHPGSGSVWTLASSKAIEFGFFGRASTFSVSRLTKRVKYKTCSNSELSACEVHELISSDSGKSWSSKEIFRNSHLGVPIINTKKQLTARIIETIWSAGKDIFYMSSDTYGKFQNNGLDYRIYYGGAELDRYIDYPTLDSTRVYFQIQSTVRATASAGNDDYFIYYGFKNESSNPKSNPHNVFKRFYSFEDQEDGQELNWGNESVASASGSGFAIYSGPPREYNKVYSGFKSTYSVGNSTAFTSVAAYTTSTTNIYAEWSMWKESGSDHAFKIKDSTANFFGIGYQFNADHEVGYFYKPGATESFVANKYVSYLTSTPTLAGPRYDRLALHVTDAGCSGWLNDLKFLNCNQNIKGIVDVSQIYLRAKSQAYFDHIIVRDKYEKPSGLIVSSSTPDNFPIVDSSHSSYYNATTDIMAFIPKKSSKVIANLRTDSTGENHTAWIHMWMAYGTPYSANNVIWDSSFSIPVGFDIPTFYNFVYDRDYNGNLLLWDTAKSIKIDVWASNAVDLNDTIVHLTKVIQYGVVEDPVIQKGEEEYRGIGVSATIQAPGDRIFNADAKIDQFFTQNEYKAFIEYLAKISKETKIPIEVLNSVLSIEKIPIEYLVSLSSFSRFLSEYLSKINPNYQIPVEYLTQLLESKEIPIENLISHQSSYNLNIEFNRKITGDIQYLIDILSGNLSFFKLPVDYLSVIGFLSKFPIEYNSILSHVEKINIEHLISSNSTFNIPINFIGVSAFNYKIPVEFNGTINIQGKIPTEFNVKISIDKKIPVEYLESLQRSIKTYIENSFTNISSLKIPVSFRSSILSSNNIPIEYLISIDSKNKIIAEHCIQSVLNKKLPIEYLKSISSNNLIPIEYLSSILSNGKLIIENGIASSSNIQIPIEYVKSLLSNEKIPVELSGGVQLEVFNNIPVEYLSSILSSSKIPIESLYSIQRGIKSIIEYLTSILDGIKIPIESQFSVRNSEQIPVEFTIKINSINQSFIEYGLKASVNGQIPIEYLKSIGFEEEITIEFLSSLLKSEKINTEFGISSSSLHKVPIEYLYSLLRGQQIPIEYSGGAAVEIGAFGSIPIEFLSSIAKDSKIPIDWLYTLGSNYQTPIESAFTLSSIGNLNIEYLAGSSTINKMPIEISTAIQSGSKIIAEWLGSIGKTGTLQIEFSGKMASVAKLHVEYGNGITIISRVNIEYLNGYLQSYKIPIEIGGALFTVILIENAQIKVPSLINVAVSVPKIKDVLAKVMSINNLNIKVLNSESEEAKTIKIEGIRVHGGTHIPKERQDL